MVRVGSSPLLPLSPLTSALLRRVAPSVDGSRYGYAAPPRGDVNDDGSGGGRSAALPLPPPGMMDRVSWPLPARASADVVIGLRFAATGAEAVSSGFCFVKGGATGATLVRKFLAGGGGSQTRSYVFCEVIQECLMVRGFVIDLIVFSEVN